MAKVHPNASSQLVRSGSSAVASSGRPLSLTVWKKSLLFNCNGFTVFDSNGDLVFRVDNYMQDGPKGQILLMDARGSPLLTIRRKRLSFGDNWLVYDGETAVNPRLSVRKHVNLLSGKALAFVTLNGNKDVVFEIQGSYPQRCCAIYDEKKRRVAEIQRKEAAGGVGLGVDVFRLVVQPEMESAVAMALVILLDQMFGSSRRHSGS